MVIGIGLAIVLLLFLGAVWYDSYQDKKDLKFLHNSVDKPETLPSYDTLDGLVAMVASLDRSLDHVDVQLQTLREWVAAEAKQKSEVKDSQLALEEEVRSLLHRLEYLENRLGI
jgi:hypothetical protein